MAETQQPYSMANSTPSMANAHQRNESVECQPAHAAKRRKKDEAERIRVSRACDRCKRKKTRCSGNHPCNLCASSGLICEFTAAYRRGKIPSLTAGKEHPKYQGGVRENAETFANVEHGHVHEVAKPFPEYHNPFHSPLNAEFATMPHDVAVAASTLARLQPVLGENFDANSRMQSARNSPEPPQTDLQGHYVGPSSGASFLLRVQKKLHQEAALSQNSSIFTFGDAPLPEFDASFFVLPPKPDAKNLVARYFDFAVPTHRFLHRPTLEAWLDEFYDSLGTFQRKGGAKGRTALLFMVFAQAKEYMPGVDRSNDVDTR
ncbi:hypothetical protein DSL72_003354 [Monilinia vaccinii-corymbosi]|uniref:Zn(2)-C6 fungal-type domain-containing protein n=1 Tax=Monilinia vaccinii-corymbosi TaxID=61207 RepID=A0A8A3P7U7_9HELO|nr:hypothetical protein DSL72_003354 [Monilinia vaccinii-corymbosi]